MYQRDPKVTQTTFAAYYQVSPEIGGTDNPVKWTFRFLDRKPDAISELLRYRARVRAHLPPNGKGTSLSRRQTEGSLPRRWPVAPGFSTDSVYRLDTHCR